MTDNLAALERLTERLTGYTPGLVLVVDDDAATRQTLCDVLEKDRWNCLEAETGERGVELAREHHPAVVLIDLRLPGIQGLEVAKRIAEVSPASWRIMITGYATVEKLRESVRLHVYGFFRKPVEMNELLTTLARRKIDARQ